MESQFLLTKDTKTCNWTIVLFGNIYCGNILYDNKSCRASQNLKKKWKFIIPLAAHIPREEMKNLVNWTFSNCAVLTKAIELLKRPRLHFENLLSHDYKFSFIFTFFYILHRSWELYHLFDQLLLWAMKQRGKTFICCQINGLYTERTSKQKLRRFI